KKNTRCMKILNVPNKRNIECTPITFGFKAAKSRVWISLILCVFPYNIWRYDTRKTNDKSPQKPNHKLHQKNFITLSFEPLATDSFDNV
ncbi:MAG: hypothetical protein NC548_59020, partial [Lachnospiraceae bacterium]|nr:hypothetical protein [Lachnospiraceae bacterium]